MTPRERVRAALDHREPDAVPIDLGASPVTGISAAAYRDLRTALGLQGDIRIATGLQIAYVDEDVQQALGVDLRRVGQLPQSWRPWTFPDGVSGLIDADLRLEQTPDGGNVFHTRENVSFTMPRDGWFFDIDRETMPLCETDDPADIEKFFATLEPRISDHRKEPVLAELRRRHQENTYAIFGDFPTAIFECWQFRGFENFLTDLLANPEFAETLMRVHAEYWLNYWTPVFEEAGDLIDLVFVSDDLGTQTGLIVSEEDYVDLVKPVHKAVWGELKRRLPNTKLFLHTDGAVEPLIPHFIELGVDILNPIQFSASGMDLAHLKKTYGSDIVFYGAGIDTQHDLQRLSPDQVRDRARRNIEILAPGGGYVFAAVHDIQANTPPANIIALYEAAREYGGR